VALAVAQFWVEAAQPQTERGILVVFMAVGGVVLAAPFPVALVLPV
jgi:hypothetical protein